jgi:hypothetical protein
MLMHVYFMVLLFFCWDYVSLARSKIARWALEASVDTIGIIVVERKTIDAIHYTTPSLRVSISPE